MSLLTSKLPTHVEIEEVNFEINTNFRNSIKFEELLLNEDINSKEVQDQAIKLYFGNQPILNRIKPQILESIVWFYSCGRPDDESQQNSINSKGKGANIYSLKYDDEYIYSAFLDQYRIDLQDIDYLHWWKFKALFKSLKSDNKIVEIMGYRSIDLKTIKDKEQKAFYKKMKDMYKLPEIINKDELEKQKAIEEALLHGGDISSIL